VGDGFLAHSMHGYFLRPGDPSRPVIFEVHRDRDGRSYAARRVIARQNGKVIFNLATSFHLAEESPDLQAATIPAGSMARSLGDRLLVRTLDVEFRKALDETGKVADGPLPSRVWLRATLDLGDDPHLHACVLTYASDMFSGLFTFVEPMTTVLLTSLDHSIWFYRPVNMNDWVLMDLVGESVSSGRGMYTGRMFTEDGVLVAGIAQESLFRKSSRATPLGVLQRAGEGGQA
jgi:acyl-CoA thioesterase-2